MLVREIMNTKPEYINPEMPLTEVAQEMRQFDFGFLPVGENEKLIGAITDRDLVIRAMAEGWNFQEKFARDVMTSKVLYCFDDDTIESAAQNMGKNKVHRLIVLDHDKHLKGIVSLSDIAKNCTNKEVCSEALKCICED